MWSNFLEKFSTNWLTQPENQTRDHWVCYLVTWYVLLIETPLILMLCTVSEEIQGVQLMTLHRFSLARIYNWFIMNMLTRWTSYICMSVIHQYISFMIFWMLFLLFYSQALTYSLMKMICVIEWTSELCFSGENKLLWISGSNEVSHSHLPSFNVVCKILNYHFICRNLSDHMNLLLYSFQNSHY